jgi:inorganic pyrophosphatase
MELATKEAHNPIAQDIKNGKLRCVCVCEVVAWRHVTVPFSSDLDALWKRLLCRNYPGPIYWNYGALPQTWEDVDVKHEKVRAVCDSWRHFSTR